MLGEDQYYYRTQITPTFKVVTPPSSEPVTIGDLQSQMNQDLIDNGGKYTRVLTAAREMFEADSGVSLLPTVWNCYLDHFPWYEESYDRRTVKLMRGPISSVASVTYINSAGASTTLSTSVYQVDIARTPSRLMPLWGQAWPVVQFSTVNAVTIQFTAGFANAAAVPRKAIQAILMLAGYWVENPTMLGQVGGDITKAYESLKDAVHWEVFDE